MANWINKHNNINKEAIDQLIDDGFSPILSQLLAIKEIYSKEEAKYYFSLSLNKLHNPYDLPNLNKALKRLINAINNKEKIFIWGDYDVDGITSMAVVITVLNKLNANFSWHVPHRIKDGYDIKIDSIQQAIKENASLILTVDCGILAFEAADYASENGIDLIITDHHTPSLDKRIPNCVAVINPKVKGSIYPFTGLSGVGIAFKLMCALSNEMGYDLKEIINDTIEYVALGTVADVAPMIDENRVLVYNGCKALNNSNKLGIKALLKVSRVTNVDSTNIGFTLAPRINAAGRISDPSIALNLLITDDPGDALIWAQELEDSNLKRQKIQTLAFEEAVNNISENYEIREDKCVVMASKKWSPGIVGLIAGKIAETYSVPALIGHIKDDGFIKGSCRSSQDINILECLQSDRCLPLFKEKNDGSKVLGGHAFAAGFEISEDNIDKLRINLSKYINNTYKELSFEDKVIYYDLKINLSDINKSIIKDLLRLSPFGSDNYSPIFLVKNVVIDAISTITSGKHLKINLKSNVQGFYNHGITGFWWNQGENLNSLIVGSLADAVIQVDISGFSSYEPKIFILDLKLKNGGINNAP